MVSYCKLRDHSREVNCCSFSTLLFATCSGDKSLQVYNLDDFTEVDYSPIKIFKYGVNNIRFNKSGHLLLTSNTEGSCHILKVTKTACEILHVFSHSDVNTVQVAVFSPDSTKFISGASDGSLALWSITAKCLIRQISGHGDGYVYAASFTPKQGKYLATGSALGDIRVWNSKEMTNLLSIEAHDEGDAGCGVSWLEFHPNYHETQDQFLLASCGFDSKTKLWLFIPSTRSLQVVNVLKGHLSPVSCCAFSTNGKMLVTSSLDKTAIIWDHISGEEVMKLQGHNSIVTSCAFSKDDSLVATTSYDKSTLVWKLSPSEDEIPLVKADNCDATQANDSTLSAKTEVTQAIATEEHEILEENKLSNNESGKSENWTCDEVSDWLTHEVQLGQYAAVFKENEIDGAELSSLDADLLKNDLKIKPLGHRNKILRAIKQLCADSANKKLTLNMDDLANSLPSTSQKNSSKTKWKSVADENYAVVKVTHTRKAKREAESNLPTEFFCPISQELMLDPVIASDGFTYERSCIEDWMKQPKNRVQCNSPMTNKILTTKTLTPNHALKAVIAQYMAVSTHQLKNSN